MSTKTSDEIELGEQIAAQGFVCLPQVLSSDEALEWIAAIENCWRNLDDQSSASIRSRAGRVYAARNFMDVFPRVSQLQKRPRIERLLQHVLGPDCGLVRGLFFDKPPEQGWSLPWHRDKTIAVMDNQLPSTQFLHPTTKAGAAHIEAPPKLLQNMLTLRFHLDDARESNGALRVIPSSHIESSCTLDDAAGRLIVADAGDVLAMRPLLSHCSGAPQTGFDVHRRVIHLEFAACSELEDGFAWRRFLKVS